MIPLVLAAMFLGLVTTAFGQRRAQMWPLGGHGSTLYSGTSHAPVTAPRRPASPNVPERSLSAGRPALGSAATPGLIVAIPTPVYDNSNLDEESGMVLPSDGTPAQPITNRDDRPPAVIDQIPASPTDDPRFANRDPATGREFGPPVSQTPANSSANASHSTSNTVDNDGKPTIYLIAFKDHRIVEALGYWIQGTMLHYVSVEYALNHASISLIDPDVSRRLNHERGIEFALTGLE
jgi:hypothetical protein